MREAVKHDNDKTRYGLIPPYPLAELAEVYTFGAKKYGDGNWLKGLDTERCISAMMRHIEEYRMGDEIDIESGLSHMAHAAWYCFAIMEYDRMDT